MRRALKLTFLALVPALALAVLGVQLATTLSAAPAPETAGGLLLSDLRASTTAPTAPAQAGTAGEKLVVEMAGWQETGGSGFRR